jgi:hypothetical protein
MSSVSPRLPAFVAWKYDDRSHHWGSVTGCWFMKRAPSGFDGDSTWITSAPNAARVWAKNGPAQKAVKSPTRSPAKGNAVSGLPGFSLAPFEPDGGVSTRANSRASVAWAAAGSVAPTPGIGGCMRNGGAGCRNPPSGFTSNNPRSAPPSRVGIVSPLPTSTHGIRSSVASSTISAVVRSAAHA